MRTQSKGRKHSPSDCCCYLPVTNKWCNSCVVVRRCTTTILHGKQDIPLVWLCTFEQFFSPGRSENRLLDEMRAAANNCVMEDARNVVRPTGTSQREIVTVCRCAKRALLRRWVTSFFICASLTRAAAWGEILYGDGQPFFSVLAISIVFTSSLTVWELSVALSAQLLASRLDMQMQPTSRTLTLRCCWSFSLCTFGFVFWFPWRMDEEANGLGLGLSRAVWRHPTIWREENVFVLFDLQGVSIGSSG